MIQIREQINRLLKVIVRCSGDTYVLKAEENLQGKMIANFRGEIIFKGDREDFARFLMKLHAKDTETNPASMRGLTYQKIIDGIVNNTNNTIWCWAKYWVKYKSLKPFTREDI